MNEGFESARYSIPIAKKLNVKRWTFKWNKENINQLQYNRLYLLKNGQGKMFLYNKELTIKPNRVYLVPAYAVIATELVEPMDKYYIHFQINSPLFDLTKYLSDSYSVAEKPQSEFLFSTVVDNYTVNTEEAKLRVEGAMDLILADFMEKINTNRTDILRFEKVLNYISENFEKNIRISELAAIMNLSELYFSNLFKKVFHITPKQYVIDKRLTKGQSLLLSTEKTVKEIAYICGFNNENYFSELFAFKVGMSPKKFRDEKENSFFEQHNPSIE